MSDPLADTYENKRYWGFYFLWWSTITALCGFVTVFALSEGQNDAAIGGLILTVLSALYARYLHNWGRWRMIFIIF